MVATLDQLQVGKQGTISAIQGEGDTLSRLMEMGLVSGSQVYVERTSPFGCPIAIRLKGTSIAIRKSDASHILLETCD